MAQAVCAAIDDMDIRGLVGTIAGDDTIFAAFENSATSEEFGEMFTN
jgi:arginine repressor